MYYTAINHDGHLRIRGKFRMYISRVFSNVRSGPKLWLSSNVKKFSSMKARSRDLFADISQCQNFFLLYMKTKNHIIVQFIMSNLVNLRSFIRIIKAFDSKRANVYKEMYARGQRLPPSIPFFVIVNKFGMVSGAESLFWLHGRIGKTWHG